MDSQWYHIYTLNPMCPSYPIIPHRTGRSIRWTPSDTTSIHSVPHRTGRTAIWTSSGTTSTHSILCVRPILSSHIGQVGLSDGLPVVPHLYTQSYVSVLSYIPHRTGRTVRWTPSGTTSIHSILCVRPIL